MKRSVINCEDDLVSIEYKRDRNEMHNSFKKEFAKFNNSAIQTQDKIIPGKRYVNVFLSKNGRKEQV